MFLNPKCQSSKSYSFRYSFFRKTNLAKTDFETKSKNAVVSLMTSHFRIRSRWYITDFFRPLHIHRDTAMGVKADVDGLLSGFGSVEGSLSDLEDKLQDNMDLIDNLNLRLNKVESKDTSNSGWNGCSLYHTSSTEFFSSCRPKTSWALQRRLWMIQQHW